MLGVRSSPGPCFQPAVILRSLWIFASRFLSVQSVFPTYRPSSLSGRYAFLHSNGMGASDLALYAPAQRPLHFCRLVFIFVSFKDFSGVCDTETIG